MNNRKKESWRIIVGILSILFIIFMWMEKDITRIYSTMPKEQLMPLLVTTVAVNLLKVAAIAAGILLLKWVIGKIKNRKK